MPCNPCAYTDFAIAVRKIVYPAYLGVGLSGAYSPAFQQNWSNDGWVFINNMWDGYTNYGCQWFCGRVGHWCGEIQILLANPPVDQYTMNRKVAKIQWAQHMHVCCGCDTQLNPNVSPPSPFIYPTCSDCI